MKKFATILICVALVFVCCLPAFAEGETTYSISINNARAKETYTAYKIFDATYSGSNYSYTITQDDEWWSVVTTPAAGNSVFGSDGTTPVTINQPSDLFNLGKFTVDGLTFTKSAHNNALGHPIYNVTEAGGTGTMTTAQAKALADKLYANVTGKTPTNAATATNASPAVATINVTNGATSLITDSAITNGDAGYYFVTTSLGALCGLNTTHPTTSIDEKNSVPSIAKTVTDAPNGTYGEVADAAFGDTVYFKIEITDGDNTDKAMVVTDTMQHGLKLNTTSEEIAGETVLTHDITVTVGGSTVSASSSTFSEPELVTDQATGNITGWSITFAPAYIASLPANTVITITYSAKVTEDAYVRGNTDDVTDPSNPTEAFNYNVVQLDYSEQSLTDNARVDTFKFQIVKTDSDDQLLQGARFLLYKPNGNTTVAQPVVLIPNADPNDPIKRYRFAKEGETGVEIEAGIAEIVGVDDVTYSLEETAAPSGYNGLTARETVAVTDTNYAGLIVQMNQDGVTYQTGGKQIINRAGSVLPSTGGIGTYLFYGIGAVLVIGAVIVLVSKKRMRAIED